VNCSASFALELAEEEMWPSGNWQPCKNAATKVRFVPMTPECIVMVKLCEAHFEAWEYRNEAIKQMLGVA
jgi:hypothetical protein